MIGVKEHTFSLLSSLSPPSALTLTASESRAVFRLRVPEHNFSIYETLPIREEHRKKLIITNPHLYNHLFCGFSNYFRQTSAIWVGKGLNNPYGVKKNPSAYKRFSVGFYGNRGRDEI